MNVIKFLAMVCVIATAAIAGDVLDRLRGKGRAQ